MTKYSYKAVMETPLAGDKDESVSVVVVEAPGCFSAGDTKEEAKANAKEALMSYLQTWLEVYGTIPLPDTEGPCWDDYAGPEWEQFTVVVDFEEVKKNVLKGRRLLEKVRVRLHNLGSAAERKFKNIQNMCHP